MDIKLGRYQNFLKLEDPTEEDALVALLGIPRNELNKLQLDKVQELQGTLEAFYELIENQSECKFTPIFEIDGIKFGFIPNLDKISYGENKDIINYSNEWDYMHKAMAVCYRPVKDFHKGKYTIEEYNGTEEYSDLMKKAPLHIVLGMRVFFYNLITQLLSYTQSSIAMDLVETLQNFPGSGEAITNYSNWLMEIYQDSMKSLDSRYINA